MQRILFPLLILCLSGSAFAQKLHIGVMGGISNYQGDLTDKVFVKDAAKGAAGLTATYEVSEHWNVRAGFTFTKLYGSDKYNTKLYLQQRNLSFTTSVSELSLVGEYATFNLSDKRFTPYLFGGVALFRYNPYSFDEAGAKVYLKPLSTEGQGLSGYPQSKPYSNTQLALPFGGGLRYAINDNVRIGLELGIRKLFTDQLDDVSGNYADAADLLRERGPIAVQYAYRGDEVANGDPVYPAKGAQRGGSLQKDWFYIPALTLSFRLGGERTYNQRGSGRRSNYGCPASPL